MAGTTVITCGNEPLYKIWGDTYRQNWHNDNGTTGAKLRRLDLVFDGGLEHVDGAKFAIARLLPPMLVAKIWVSTQGLQPTGGDPVTVDMGCVSYERDCHGEPLCQNLTHFFDGLDLSTALCNEAGACGPWSCSDNACSPNCCPEAPVDDCECPEEAVVAGCGMSDLVLTLHGTPGRCSKLTLLFLYQ